jgi:hypothetical protein
VPQLLELASELGNKLRWILGGGRCCQTFACDKQWFPVDELRHGRLQDFFKGPAHYEENEGRASVQRSCARHIMAALSDRYIRSPRPLAA